MSNLDQRIGSPENFHKRCEPHENDEAAQEAFDDFFSDVYGLANEHQIAEVLIAVNLRVKDRTAVSTARIGSDLGAIDLSVVAAAYGRKIREARDKSLAAIGELGAITPAPEPAAATRPAEDDPPATVMAILVQMVEKAGITPEQLAKAWQEHAYRKRARETIEKAREAAEKTGG